MSQSQSSLRSMGILTICSFLQLSLQVGIQLLLARQFGAARTMDTYYAAISLPTVITAFFAGSLNAAFITTYTTDRLNTSKESAFRFASQLGTWLIVLFTLLSIVGYIFAEQFVRWLHHGFDEEKVRQTANVFRVLTWLTITNGLTGFLSALHHGEKRFRIPAFSGLIGVGATVALLCFSNFSSTTEGVAQAVLIGSAICVLLQSKLFVIHYSYSFKLHPAMRKLFILMAPIIIGALLMQVVPLVNRYIASDQEGAISSLEYAMRVVTAILTLTSSFSIVLLPTLSAQHSEGDTDSFKAEIAHAMRFMVALMVPICAGLSFFSEEIIRDLFQRGQFTAANSQEVGFLLVMFLGVIVGSGVGTIFGNTFVALKDTTTPTLIALFIVPIAIALKFRFGTQDSYGAIGIAATTSLSFFLSLVVFAFIARYRIGTGIYRGVLLTFLHVVPSTAVAIGVSALIAHLPIRFSTIIAAPFGAVSYLLVMYLLRNEFALRMVGYLSRKTKS